MDHYTLSLKLRIDWSELDLFGHVNNVAYFKYIQASRVNYWEAIGLSKLHGEMREGPMLATTSCQFRKPLFFPGEIVVHARVDFIKTTSFGIHHRIVNAAGEVAAEAQDVIVMFDFVKNEKIPVPAALREIIGRLEKRTF